MTLTVQKYTGDHAELHATGQSEAGQEYEDGSSEDQGDAQGVARLRQDGAARQVLMGAASDRFWGGQKVPLADLAADIRAADGLEREANAAVAKRLEEIKTRKY